MYKIGFPQFFLFYESVEGTATETDEIWLVQEDYTESSQLKCKH